MLSVFYTGRGFSLTGGGDAVLHFAPAKIELGGKVRTLDAAADGHTRVSAGPGLRVTDTVADLGGGLFRIDRVIENIGVGTLCFKDILEIRTAFAPAKYLIPCVNYNGNPGCKPNTPMGLSRDGEAWTFAYDRTGIPACTLTEDRHFGAALFASDCDENSLRASCSMEKCTDGSFAQRIIRPVTEAPYTYSGKDTLTERYDEYLTLTPGARFASTSYAFACVPMYENYAAANLLDRAAEIFDFDRTPVLTPEQTWNLGIDYAKALLYDYEGHKLIITHFAPRLFRSQHGAAITPEEMERRMKDPYYTELGRFDERFEMGWADQGLLNARMLAVDAAKRGDRDLLDTAIGIFDAWAEKQQENGLLYSQFQQYYVKETYDFATPDVCNFGWGAAEMARMYAFLAAQGIDKPAYKRFAVRLCDFFVEHFSEKYGFGKSWTLDGKCVMENGSIGGFMIMGLLSLYRVTGNAVYLDCAERAMVLYTARDVDDFCITAGAIDCACIDKETAYPFIKSALDLYDITGKAEYLVTAEKAAYYFQSWMYYYDALYPDDSEFTKLGYYTHGGTSVSTQHPAIDPWGVIVIPEYMRLAKATGDMRWTARARALWCNALLCITPKGGITLHGHDRPEGLQSEAFFIARWTRYRKNREERGHLNDMFVGWPAAFRMTTLYRMQTELGGDFSVIEK